MKKSCLIVDDSSTIRKIVRHMLEEFGLSCAEAENGSLAYDYCTRQLPDLIILDWNMPVMTGIEFIQKLNETRQKKIPPVIFCTTETDMSFIGRALEQGAADYIMKPFEKDMLREKLTQMGFIDDAGAHCVPG